MLFESKIGIKRAQKMFNKEKSALQLLKVHRNQTVILDLQQQAQQRFSKNAKDSSPKKKCKKLLMKNKQNRLLKRYKYDFTTLSVDTRKMDFSLCMVLPGTCYELKKDISPIFEAEKKKIQQMF